MRKTVRETSVYKLVTRIKSNSLTNNGFFDLNKIPKLRIDCSSILLVLRKKLGMTQKQMSKVIGVPLRTYIGWEFYKKAMPFSTFIKLVQKLKLNEDKIYKLIEKNRSKFTLGKHHGKNRIQLPINPQSFLVGKYLVPMKYGRVYVVKNTPDDIKKKIRMEFPIDAYILKRFNLLVINSLTLSKFLKTFFEYEKMSKLNFPLTKLIPQLIKKKTDLDKCTIIPLLLQDGFEKLNNTLCISGTSKIIHNIWSDAWYYSHNLLPSSYMISYKNIFITAHKPASEVILKLRKFCPNFKTSPSKNQTTDDYLNNEQPNIKFLLKAKKNEQIIALRLWFCTEGCVEIHRDSRSGLIVPELKIGCTHPKLIKTLQNVGEKLKIHFCIRKGNTWSGFEGLTTSSLRSSIRFLGFGGFINGVDISSKSKYFRGLDKQGVFLSILEYARRQRDNLESRKLQVSFISEKIKKITKEQELKQPEFYIDYFG